MSRSVVANVENSTQRPSVEYLVAFAGICGMSLDMVVGYDSAATEKNLDLSGVADVSKLLEIVRFTEDIDTARTVATLIAAQYEEADAKLGRLRKLVKDFTKGLKDNEGLL